MRLELPDARSEADEVIDALRMRAIRARKLGYPVEAIADVLGVRPESVYRWSAAFEEGGVDALPQARTGRPVGSGRRLTAEQEQQLRRQIEEHCPDELGIASALWTRQAVRELIHQQCGVRLPTRTVGEYLRRWGFTPQKPVRKAYKQDPLEVQHWLHLEYPRIAARAKAEGAEIHWGDETGVRSTCHVGRGYAPPGQTPELTVPGSRFSVNMISSVTNQGKVRFMIYEGRMTAARFIVFLRRLIQGATCKLLLIVDRLSVHEAEAVREWVEQHRDRIELIFLPKYSPELNPDEYLNCDLKANLNEEGLPHNRGELKSRLSRFMHKLGKLSTRVKSYFQHPHLQYAASPE
jgi:transposase